MTKDKFGICFSFYAVVALVLAFMGQVLLCGLLLGFVIIMTKDEWLTKQVMQAFFLTLFSAVISQILNVLNVFYGIPVLGAIISGLFGIVSGLISLLVLLFAIIGIMKVLKGEDASIPLFSSYANKAYGYVAKTVYEEK